MEKYITEDNLWNILPYATTLYKHKDWTFTARIVLNSYSQKRLTVKWNTSRDALDLLVKEYTKLLINS